MPHHNPVLRLAILISLLFHLSMVTLFQIVIFFPQNEIDYFIFRIIDPRTQQARAATVGERLRIPSADEALERIAPGAENSTLRDIVPKHLKMKASWMELSMESPVASLLEAGLSGMPRRDSYSSTDFSSGLVYWLLFSLCISLVNYAEELV